MATFQERYQAAMVLGGVGDSLGNKWRHCPSGIQIYDELMKLGGVDVLDIKPPDWRISSCTRMHLLTARAFAKFDQMTSTKRLLKQIMFEYCSEGFDSHDPFNAKCIKACLVLFHLDYRESKNYITAPFHAGATDSPAAVRAMCIGLRYHNPEDFRFLLEVSIESGRITHHHPVGYLGAFATALFTSYAIQRRPFRQWGHGLINSLPEALEYIKQSGKEVPENIEVWNDFVEKWKHFLELRGLSFGTIGPVIPKHDDIANREEFYILICLNCCPGSEGWDAPMIAYDAIMCFDGSWKDLCMRSICHGGLSNVTGSIAACWYGAMYGYKGIKKCNFLKVESAFYLQALGHMIHAISSPHFSIHGQMSNIGITRRSVEPHEDPITDKRIDAQEKTKDVDAKIPELQNETQVINKTSEEVPFLADAKKIVLQTVAQVTHNKNEEAGIVGDTNNPALQTELPQTDENNETLNTLVNDNKAVLQREAPEMNVNNVTVDAYVDAMVPALQKETKIKYANDQILDADVVSKRKETEDNITYKVEAVDKKIYAKADVFQTETKVIYNKREDVMALIGTKVVALQEETLSERANRIANTIYSHIKSFCDNISYLPPLIKTIEILKVGSFNEGTKIIHPDEFDFIAVLEGKFELGSLQKEYEFWKTNDECIHMSLEQIFDNFTKNLYQVIVNKDDTTLMKNVTLYNFLFSDQEHVPLPTVSGLNMTVKLLSARRPNIVLEFRESNMVISVDLTPAVRTTNWRKTFQPDHVVHRELRKSILEKESLLLVNYKETLKLTMTEVEVAYVKQTLQKKHKRLYVYLKYFNGLYAKGNVFEIAGLYPFSSYMLKTVCIYHDELCDTKKNKNVSLQCLHEIITILEKSLNNGYLLPSENLKDTSVGYLPSLFDKNMNLYYEPTKPVDFLIEFRKLMVRDLQSIFVPGRKWADLNDFCSTVEKHVSNSADMIGSKTWSYSKYLLPLNYAS